MGEQDRGVLQVPAADELAHCCRKGLHDRAGELLAWGASPDTTVGGRSVLSLACEHGHPACVRLLLRAGAKVTPHDLVWAVRSNAVPVASAVADALFFAGVQYDFWFEDRPFLTHEAFLRTAKPEMVRWLLDQGADPEETDGQGRSALAVALRLGLPPEVEALLRR